jgi:hypothetical protein
MWKAAAFFFDFSLFLSGFFAGVPLFAQDSNDEETPEDDWEGVVPSLYASGEQNFVITLGVTLPPLFTSSGGTVPSNVKVGGTGSLAYNYFVTRHVFVGGEISGMFAGTLGKNMLYIIPFGLRLGYQFVLGKFEFPLALMIGGAPQTYLDTNYFGLFLKPSASVFFRFNPDWSFGFNTAWWFVPEWTKDSKKNMNAHFLELTLSARFHF